MELLDNSDKPFRKSIVKEGKARFQDLLPGEIYARIVIDSNGDGGFGQQVIMTINASLKSCFTIRTNFRSGHFQTIVKSGIFFLHLWLVKNRLRLQRINRKRRKKRRDPNQERERQQQSRQSSPFSGMGGLGGAFCNTAIGKHEVAIEIRINNK